MRNTAIQAGRQWCVVLFNGGDGADTFEFVPLINATQEVLDQYRSHNSGKVNWARVAGENDNVHDHWVEGIGNDTITDYSEDEGDTIKITGHTASIASITYGEDERSNPLSPKIVRAQD